MNATYSKRLPFHIIAAFGAAVVVALTIYVSAAAQQPEQATAASDEPVAVEQLAEKAPVETPAAADAALAAEETALADVAMAELAAADGPQSKFEVSKRFVGGKQAPGKTLAQAPAAPKPTPTSAPAAPNGKAKKAAKPGAADHSKLIWGAAIIGGAATAITVPIVASGGGGSSSSARSPSAPK